MRIDIAETAVERLGVVVCTVFVAQPVVKQQFGKFHCVEFAFLQLQKVFVSFVNGSFICQFDASVLVSDDFSVVVKFDQCFCRAVKREVELHLLRTFVVCPHVVDKTGKIACFVTVPYKRGYAGNLHVDCQCAEILVRCGQTVVACVGFSVGSVGAGIIGVVDKQCGYFAFVRKVRFGKIFRGFTFCKVQTSLLKHIDVVVEVY